MLGLQLHDIKIGVIGCGYWGSKIIRNLCSLEKVVLSQICDLDNTKLTKISELYPSIQTTTQLEDLLTSDLDAIVIATPTVTHYSLARLVLQANKHLLVEKPLTINSEQAKEIIQLAQYKNLILLVGHIFEYDLNIQKIAHLISTQQLGEIYYIDSIRGNFGLLRTDVDVMWDLAIHDLSICNYLLNSRPITVTAIGKSCVELNNQQVCDVAVLTLKYPQELLVTIRVSWLEPQKIRKLTISSSSKMLIYEPTANNNIILYDRRIEIHKNNPSPSTEIIYHYGDIQCLETNYTETLYLELEHFVQCIQGLNKPKTCGSSGLEVINILEAAHKSLVNSSIEETIDYDIPYRKAS